MMDTSGTMNKIRLSRLSNPLEELSSRLKTLSEVASKNKVYAMTILLRNISMMTNLIIFLKAIVFA